MAAIDPNAEPEYDDVDDKKPARATLKIVRVPGDMFDDEDDSDYDTDEDGEDLQNGYVLTSDTHSFLMASACSGPFTNCTPA